MAFIAFFNAGRACARHPRIPITREVGYFIPSNHGRRPTSDCVQSRAADRCNVAIQTNNCPRPPSGGTYSLLSSSDRGGGQQPAAYPRATGPARAGAGLRVMVRERCGAGCVRMRSWGRRRSAHCPGRAGPYRACRAGGGIGGLAATIVPGRIPARRLACTGRAFRCGRGYHLRQGISRSYSVRRQ
jgi:hypothetical protein